MIRSIWKTLFCALVIALLFTKSANAHLGNKDVYQTIAVGRYKLFVTVRMPLVIPGVATVEARSSGALIHRMTITPLPLTGEASKHPPTPDTMQSSTSDQAFFTGSLWIMASGSWQVRFDIDGADGAATASVPVPAVPIGIQRMQRPMGVLLTVLGCILVLGVIGIAMAAAREARLAPGLIPGLARRRRALAAGALAFIVCALVVWLGAKWWNVEAADYAAEMHRSSELQVRLDRNHLDLWITQLDTQAKDRWKVVKNSDLLADHGHLMHLYAMRWPEMDAVFHLHPAPKGESSFSDALPVMPPGTYHLYADVVFRNGFPETETSTLMVPPGMIGAPLGSEDASAMPQSIFAGKLGPEYSLPDGYRMVWEKPATLTANTPYTLVFHLLDPQGRPAADMRPYLGMAGHAAFVKTDGTAFAHTHPEGSAAMPAVALANQMSGSSINGMAMNGMAMNGMVDANAMTMASEPLSPTAAFPYGFPSPGSYRIFIQMRHGSTTETGAFDAIVR